MRRPVNMASPSSSSSSPSSSSSLQLHGQLSGGRVRAGAAQDAAVRRAHVPASLQPPRRVPLRRRRAVGRRRRRHRRLRPDGRRETTQPADPGGALPQRAADAEHARGAAARRRCLRGNDVRATSDRGGVKLCIKKKKNSVTCPGTQSAWRH